MHRTATLLLGLLLSSLALAYEPQAGDKTDFAGYTPMAYS